jgi:hypothetical protein
LNLRTLVDAVSWQVRGPFAFSPIRDLGFAARGAFQLAEMRARTVMARELGAPDTRTQIDPDLGYVRLPADPRLEVVAATGSSIASMNVSSEVSRKEFFRARSSNDDERVTLLRAALDRGVLTAVTSYLGTVPVICEADFYSSVPNGPPWTKSQLWHCDDDSARIVKLFVYCEDVTADNGPFELISARISEAARRAVRYRYAGRRYRVSDHIMDAHVPRSEQLAFEGPRTSGFLIDTSRCFHRGSRIESKNKRRVAAIVTYVQPNARKLPLRLRDGRAPLVHLASRFSDSLQRAVLGVPVA